MSKFGKINIFLSIFLFSFVLKANFRDIHKYCKKGKLNMVCSILENDASQLNVQDEQGATPLMYAVRGGHIQIVKYLLSLKANINSVNIIGNSALMLAAHGHGMREMVNLLIEYGADTSLKNGVNATAFDIAQQTCINFELLKPQKGNEEPSVYFKKNGKERIHKACHDGNLEWVEFILEKEPNQLEAVCTLGQTPLLCAASYGHHAIVKLLLEKGAKVNALNNQKNTALINAAGFDDSDEVIKLLIAYNADLNHQNPNGFTALSLTVQLGKLNNMEILLAAGAFDLADKDGVTAKSYAKKYRPEYAQRMKEILVANKKCPSCHQHFPALAQTPR